jgi:hypothetical protein
MALSVTPAIPASQIVSVLPSVLPAGGDALDLIGLILTQNTRPPIGSILTFADEADVGTFFGPLSQEAALATIYFNGPDNSTAKPGSLLFAQYPFAAVSAYLRGGNISGLPLATLQGFTGVLNVTIDAVLKTGTVNLSAATSFSNAANIIADALDIESVEAATFTGSIATTVLTVTVVATGALAVGQIIEGAGVTAGTYIASLGTGTGGTGTYNISVSQTVASEAMTADSPGVSYDSVSGAFVFVSETTSAGSTISYGSGAMATNLLLTQALGATLSQGAAPATPAAFMPTITAQTTNWASFMTTWEPVDADKEAFATWTNGQKNRFVYAMWDTSAANIVPGGPSVPVAFVNSGDLSGIMMIYENPAVDATGQTAAFVMGFVASLDFGRLNGRMTQAFRSQSGLQPQVFSASIATALIGYGMNFYGDYTTANQAFVWLYPGSVSGPFKWLDSYVDQIWLNNELQLALMELLQNVGSIPYNAAGYALIEAACFDPIRAAVNFGAIRAGVTLSAAQIAEVNSAAGIAIDQVLSNQGWYLQVKDASPQVRAARGSPPCTFWYMDGQSVQQITLASIEVQ